MDRAPLDAPELPPPTAAIELTLAAAEAEAARVRLAAIEAGRRKGGLAGAAMAGVMITLHEIYEAPIRDVDVVQVAESPGGPGDIDVDGIGVTVGDVEVWAPPPGAGHGSP